MKLEIDSIKKRERLSKDTVSIRLFNSDIVKLQKMADDKDMSLNEFIAELLHLILNSK